MTKRLRQQYINGSASITKKRKISHGCRNCSCQSCLEYRRCKRCDLCSIRIDPREESQCDFCYKNLCSDCLQVPIRSHYINDPSSYYCRYCEGEECPGCNTRILFPDDLILSSGCTRCGVIICDICHSSRSLHLVNDMCQKCHEDGCELCMNEGYYTDDVTGDPCSACGKHFMCQSCNDYHDDTCKKCQQ